MGKAFFTGWELWQQMTFVLACGIVATILLGLCKLRYDTLKIRKYSKVDKGKGKKVQTPEMLEAQTVVPKHDDDIPFGIRAIESGIEVDGVWISRSNTPVGSSRSSMSRVDLAQPQSQPQMSSSVHPQPVNASSRASSRPASSFDVAVNAERIRTNDSRDVSPARHGDHCVNCGHHASARNSTLHALEGKHMGSSASNKSSRRTSDESEEYMALPEGLPYPAAYINSRPPSHVFPHDPRTDLNLLQSHRMSHVAETGQLTPRVRRPGHSGEWASVADKRGAPEVATANGVDYFVPQQKTPSPPPLSTSPPKDAPIHSASYSTQDGHVTNGERQAVPLLETYAARPFYLPDVYQPRGPGQQPSYDEIPIEVQTQQNNGRDSQVLRKVNSGFEILRPGTFAPPSPDEPMEAPATQKRQSKRLQKKRTNSQGSRTSHFVEQV
ncbi:hypothetical protein DM02DRAFT_535378 [Periconia macrospinosa]|uniref:Uncharacterized protein n=1 Tax=Periconia macrospinosa TaxID=97972 RepID=A0A2V1DEA5_9PLEO|nr:hypothetical protein DM02DRAFT_535378 [Periconia macrospinosa]